MTKKPRRVPLKTRRSVEAATETTKTETEEIAVTTPAGSLRARGTDLIALVTIIGIVIIAMTLYYQGEEQKRAAGAVVEANRIVTQALNDLTRAQMAIVREQRFTSCLLATDQDKRGDEFMRSSSYCNRTQ